MTPEPSSESITTPRTDALEERNQVDDARQDASDARQDRAELKQVRTNQSIVTLRDIYEIADKRMERLEHAMEKLVDTTNHRLEKFEVWTQKFDQLLDMKADKDELITSWGERILRISWARWAVGAVLLAGITTAGTQHWFVRGAEWLEGFFS